MNTFFILYFRENNGNGEYIILTDPDVTPEEYHDYERYGYHFESCLKCETDSHTHNLPFESELMKQL